MTTYGGLEQVFEITESPPPWKNIDFNKPKSFTEIFAQPEFDHDSPQSSSYSSPFTLSPSSSLTSDHDEKHDSPQSSSYSSSFNLSPSSSLTFDHDELQGRSDSASSFASSLCSELAFKSCDGVEDQTKNEEKSNERIYKMPSSRRSPDKKLPPPLPSIGRSGKPWGWLHSIRENGRFTLTQMTIQSHEFMQARRENGRLKLQYFSVER